MATNTTNYGWTKPDYEDDADIAVLNETLDAIDEQVKTNENNISLITPELIELVDSGAKNLIELDLATIKSLNNSSGYTWNNNAVTNKGVTYTINNDMSISLTGTASGLSYIRLKSNFTVPKGTLILSGCPSGGAANTYRLYTDGITNGWEDVGQSSEKTFASDVTATYLTIAVNSGTTTGFTFKPMICTKAAWDVSQKYVPYVPTNAELYEMIKALQS